MLKFEQKGPKEWSIVSQQDEPINIKLVPSSVTNKFHIVASYIERVAEFHGEAFSDWFIQLIKDCQDVDKRAETFIKNNDKHKTYVD